ncbi:MAG: 4Fe-4S ferredoxin, partial [Armatimonadetes bacterium]|nr:4Fe-4S ferredoxin [Armatimonadota bacterium]
MELRLLRMIFTLDQAELSFRLRLPFETVEEIAARTGVPQQGLKLQIMPMSRAGQAFTAIMGGTRYFKMLPWVFGTYEMQCHRMDREFAEINAQYAPHFSRQFFAQAPALMQVLPVEAELSEKETPLPYERVSALLEAGQSFLVDDCIRKKEQALLGQPCDRPLQVCLAVAPIPGVFDSAPQGRSLSRAEAYALLEYAEAMGLVHLTSNVQQGGFYICNCCPCCCRVLRAITRLGMPASEVVSAHYR